MPLLDHFHPPISERRSWEGFHGLWAAALVENLNGHILGEDYYAEMQVHVGSQVEVDVATLEEQGRGLGKDGGTATLAAWSPPATSLVIPAVFPDDIEVQVYSTIAGAALVAAIELVSPGNKDRPEARRAFAAKCVGYLTRGIGLIVVDIVTNRSANLHNEIIALFGAGEQFELPTGGIYATAYRPSRKTDGDGIELWKESLAIGASLPTLPLALRNDGIVPADLESTYMDARQRYRLSGE